MFMSYLQFYVVNKNAFCFFNKKIQTLVALIQIQYIKFGKHDLYIFCLYLYVGY